MRPRFPPFEPLLADFPSPHGPRSVIPDTGACDKHHESAWPSALRAEHSAELAVSTQHSAEPATRETKGLSPARQCDRQAASSNEADYLMAEC
jgi:hypothetical protein